MYGIVEHLGGQIQYGHYIAYIQNGTGVWYRMNDSSVSVVNKNNISGLNPYMLFYRKRQIKEDTQELKRLRRNSLSRRSSHEIELDFE